MQLTLSPTSSSNQPFRIKKRKIDKETLQEKLECLTKELKVYKKENDTLKRVIGKDFIEIQYSVEKESLKDKEIIHLNNGLKKLESENNSLKRVLSKDFIEQQKFLEKESLKDKEIIHLNNELKKLEKESEILKNKVDKAFEEEEKKLIEENELKKKVQQSQTIIKILNGNLKTSQSSFLKLTSKFLELKKNETYLQTRLSDEKTNSSLLKSDLIILNLQSEEQKEIIKTLENKMINIKSIIVNKIKAREVEHERDLEDINMVANLLITLKRKA